MLGKILSLAREEEGTFLPGYLTMLLLDDAEHETKNLIDWGECYPPRPKADSTLQDLAYVVIKIYQVLTRLIHWMTHVFPT